MLSASLYIEKNNGEEEEVKIPSSSIVMEDETPLDTSIGNKVEKVEGKGLSTCDFTKEDKNKLDSILGKGVETYIFTKNFTKASYTNTWTTRFLSYGNIRHYFINITWDVTTDNKKLVLGNLVGDEILPDSSGISQNVLTNNGSICYIYIDGDGTVGVSTGDGSYLKKKDGVRANIVFIKSEVTEK